jgi:hypothetical protein
MFHAKLNELDHPPMPPSDDNYSRAHVMAWQTVPLPLTLHPQITRKIEGLFAHYRPFFRGDDIIHADLCGNILFHDSLDPCIIDFSPDYGSVEYAEAILVADAVAWENAPIEIVNLLPSKEHYRQHLLRAVGFRLIVRALFEPQNVNRFLKGYGAYRPVVEIAAATAG